MGLRAGMSAVCLYSAAVSAGTAGQDLKWQNSEERQEETSRHDDNWSYRTNSCHGLYTLSCASEIRVVTATTKVAIRLSSVNKTVVVCDARTARIFTAHDTNLLDAE